MMRVFLLFVAFMSSILLYAQHINEDLKRAFSQINEEVNENGQAYEQLNQLTTNIGHRLTGSKNGKKAEQFVYDALKSYGFEEVKFQPFTVQMWGRKSLSLTIIDDKGNLEKIKTVALAHSPVAEVVNAELIDLGNGLEADYIKKPTQVKGKIVLASLHLMEGTSSEIKNLHRSEKTALARKYGAAGIILYNGAPNGVLLTGTASVGGKLITIPAICIGLEDGLRLKEKLKTASIHAQVNMKNVSKKAKARNVIATIKGSEFPNEKIIVGAHLDSWDLATGAIDNGIGSMAVLDMARLFKKLNIQPKRTIEFIFFMGEEQGLLGSNFYVESAQKNNELDQVKYMLNFDMTNNPKNFFSTREENRNLFTELGSIAQAVAPQFNNKYFTSVDLHSDHQPFMLQGIPIAGGGQSNLSKEVLNCYHADCDSFDLVDKNGLLNTVRFGAMLLYGLANTENIPVEKLNDEAIKQQMIDANLEEPLKISGNWRW